MFSPDYLKFSQKFYENFLNFLNFFQIFSKNGLKFFQKSFNFATLKIVPYFPSLHGFSKIILNI